MQVAAYCMLNKGNAHDKYAVIYFLLTLTVTYILGQLPVAILGLKYSTSIEKIDKISAAIDFNDVDYLINTADFLEKHSIEKIEDNRIVLLKDIGLNAIKDGDWILPQKILSNGLDLIYQSIKVECPVATTGQAMYIYLWTGKHFQRTAIKNADHITVSVLNGQALNLYYFLKENKIYNRSLVSHLDDYYKELVYSIILSKDFAETRDYWLRDYTEIMSICLSSLHFSDEALPTKHYIFSERDKEVNYPSYADYYEFWHHLIHTQISNLVDIIEFAIEQKDSRFYHTYHWQIRNLMGKVASLKQLTDSQKREYISELLYRSHHLDSLSMDNQLSYNQSVVSHIEIEQWAKKGWTELYRAAMYHQSSMVKTLIKKGGAYISLLDELFLLGRSICNGQNNMNDQVKEEIITYLLETGLKLYDNKGESLKLKYDLQYQLTWLFNDFVKRDQQFEQLTAKFQDRIAAAVEGFDYYNSPEF